MEVVKQTPLSQVHAYKQEIIEKEKRINELSEAKADLEIQLINVMDSSALMYEENLDLKTTQISLMEAVADMYEMILGGNS